MPPRLDDGLADGQLERVADNDARLFQHRQGDGRTSLKGGADKIRLEYEVIACWTHMLRKPIRIVKTVRDLVHIFPFRCR